MPTKLGQNFLNDGIIAEKIVSSAGLKWCDNVLEIGPGKGILTKELLKKSKKVIGIEVDLSLKNSLLNKFKNNTNFELLIGDILSVNISKMLSDRKIDKYKVIANIPYYITSKIIRLFLESENRPEEMILMTQKEVAERIVAIQGKMSKLSVSVQYYGKPEILFFVDRENFTPEPSVDSAVIKIKNIKKKSKNDFDKVFFKIVRAGFCARRKILMNNLANSLHIDKKEIENKLKSVGIDPNIRAQSLSISDWKRIAKKF